MQIPFDLEFVENRPTVKARAIAMPEPFPARRAGRAGGEKDAFDALLSWVHRLLCRLDGR